MTDATQIHPDKLRAFHNTSYRLGHTEHDIVLKVEQYSPRLEGSNAIPQLILLR